MQIVILLSQIRVNSMAIVRMKSSDFNDQQDWFQMFSSSEAEAASSVEQVCFTVCFSFLPFKYISFSCHIL